MWHETKWVSSSVRSDRHCGAVFVSWAALAGEGKQFRLEVVVPLHCGIEVSRHSVALDLAAGFDWARVATIAESCNSPSGYTVTLNIASEGALLRGDDAVPYDAHCGSKFLALGAPAVLGRAGPAIGIRHDFAISAPAVSGLPSGTYQDTVTITIAAR